jgi:hypothetical protein
MDGVETVDVAHLRPLEDATAFVDEPAALRAALERDGYLFVRGLVPAERITPLRRLVLDHAQRVSWLDPAAPAEEARRRPGLRLGDHQVPEWNALQARVQTSEELWNVGDAPAVHRVLARAFGRPSFLFLGMNTCRVVTPGRRLASRPHQDAHYIHMGNFATVWVPLGDCPMSLGPLAVWPGSHIAGLRPHWGVGIVAGGVHIDSEPVWHSTDFTLGDGLVLTRHTIHCGLPNTTAHTLRLSVDLRYGFASGDAD